jgi:hypothetical protein
MILIDEIVSSNIITTYIFMHSLHKELTVNA